MPLLTRYERQILNLALPANMHVDFAQRLADASTLQCAGRVATSHVRLVANPQEADMVRLTAMPVTCDERWYPGSGCLYAFTSDGTAPAG